jgi:hypothetical protein
MMRTLFLRLLPLVLLAVASLAHGQTGASATNPSPVELVISGPHVIHRGDNLWFTATLTNRSSQIIAVPARDSGRGWVYIGGGWWKIVDRSRKQLQYKLGTVALTDNNIGMPTYQDSDFVLLKPGEKIEYTHETLGDPSDKFIFPGDGTFFVSLSWSFCPPKVKPEPNDAVGYTCGITRALSQSVKEVLLATPSYEVHSNVWKISLE